MSIFLKIVPSDASYVDQFQFVVDAVARERKYLGSIVGFPVEKASKFIADILDGGGVQFFAVEDGKMVGWCDILRHKFIGCEHVGVLGMGVLASHRGKGIGRQLLATTVNAAFKAGFSKVELEVFSSNIGAIALYEKDGFIVEGVKKGCRILDGTTDDIICMAHFREASGSVA